MSFRSNIFLSCVMVALLPLAEAQVSRLDKRFHTEKTVRPAASARSKSSVTQAKPSRPVSHYVSYSGLYNDESVSLPAWFVDEVSGLNEQLKERLSPSDYLEVLKGERELYGEFATKNAYYAFIDKKQRKNEFLNTYLDLSALKKKLRSILDNPDDYENFARPQMIRKRVDGVVYREYIGFSCDDFGFHKEYYFTDDHYILSCRSGKSRGCSYIWTFWNARTGRVAEQFYCPTDVLELGILARKSDMGNIYLLGSARMETSGLKWNDSTLGTYLIAPEICSFQSIYGRDGIGDDFEEWLTVPLNAGKISKSCGRVPNYAFYSLPSSSGSLPAFWSRSSEAGMSGFYIVDRTNRPRNATGDSSVYTIYENKTNGFALEWDSLLLKRLNTDDVIKKRELAMQKIWHALSPAPTDRNGNLIDEAHKNTDEGRNIMQLDDVSTSELLYCVSNDNQDDSICSILGLYTTYGHYLFPSVEENENSSILPYEGKIENYEKIISFSNRRLGKYDFISWKKTPWRKLKVHRSENSDELLLEIVCKKNEDRMDFREEFRLVKVNLTNKTFTTIRRWEYFGTKLIPCWIPQKEWFLRPESDYQYSIIAVREGEEKIADFYVDPAQGYAIVLPDGRYVGSPGCESFLAYGDGDQVVGMQALAPWRNRPAEVLETIGGNADDIAALRETTKRWLVKQGVAPENMPAEPKLNEFPRAEVNMPELFCTEDTARFSVKLRATARAIRKLEVRADGVRIPQSWEGALEVAAGEEKELQVEVPLATGQNWIEVTPVDADGISGDTARFRTIYKGAYPSDLFIVALGVSDYDNDELKLQYAAIDARDIAAAFEKYGAGRKHTLVLTDKEVQDRSVLEKVRLFLSAASLEDRVVLYVAGHGMLDDQLNYYYAPAGFDAECIEETGIPMTELTACLQGVKARRRLLLLDTCHSGVLGEEGEEKLALSGLQLPHGVRAIQHRSMKVRKAMGALNTVQKKRYIEDMFSRGSTERGINIIAGAEGAEFALESASWKNGVFTAAIMQALQDEKSDLNGDGTISVAELQYVVSMRVAELTGGAQRPSTVASEGSEGFVMVQRAVSNKEPEAAPASTPLIQVEPAASESVYVPVREVELRQLTEALRSTVYNSAVEKLYQRRLLQLLEMMQNGASVNTVLPNANGTTALHNACGLSRVDVVRWLLANGADINARTAKGATVEACVGGANASTISQLLREAKKKK